MSSAGSMHKLGNYMDYIRQYQDESWSNTIRHLPTYSVGSSSNLPSVRDRRV